MRKRRTHLWETKRGKCNYCGRLTIHPELLNGNSGIVPTNGATFDHVYSYWDIRRGAKRGNRKVVLSCYKCNQDKNIREWCVNSQTTYTLL